MNLFRKLKQLRNDWKALKNYRVLPANDAKEKRKEMRIKQLCKNIMINTKYRPEGISTKGWIDINCENQMEKFLLGLEEYVDVEREERRDIVNVIFSIYIGVKND